MKTRTLKQATATFWLCALAITSPLMAQSQGSSDAGSGVQSSQTMDEPAGAGEDRGSDLWWVGLLGLLGLFGLKRRHAHDDRYETRTAGA